VQALVLAFMITIAGGVPAPSSITSDVRLPTRAHVTAPTQQLGVTIGRLEIPAIGLDEQIREGVNISVIDRGVAHWAGTAEAGGYGNMVLAGHRTTRTEPFHDLDRMQPGDSIAVTGFDGRVAEYIVTETVIVTPSDMWIVEQTDVPMLTLFACHPKRSARQRIVVRAELVDVPVLHFP
jgi:sortase A